MRNARRRGLLALLAVVFGATLLVPGAAQAGTYNVYSCSIDGGFYPNNAWVVANNPGSGTGSVAAENVCSRPGDPLSVAYAGPGTFTRGSYVGDWFYAPSGTYISDFALVVEHYWYAPGLNPGGGQPDETTYTATGVANATVGVADSGAGQWVAEQQQRAALDSHWFGYRAPGSSGAADSGVVTITPANSAHALQPVPRPTVLNISSGCYANGEPACSLSAAAVNHTYLFGARVTLRDDDIPDLTGPKPDQGLRDAGTRTGSEAVMFSAADNSGIRRAEMVDVTDAANPRVVAAKDYNSGTLTAQKARCEFTRPLPCPNLTNETLAANPPIAGHRTLLVRVTDSADNQTVSAPFAVYARGPANGANVTDSARLTAGFPAKVYRRSKAGKRYYTYVLRPSRTVSYGKGGTLRGILRNADGQPITGADVRILVRENRTGAQYVDRGGLTTGADGRVSLGIPAGSSRTYQLTYKAYVGDDNLAARSKATLNTRARITARAPRHVRSRGTARFRGTLVGRPRPRRGVTLELQAFQPHRGWRTVGTARTGKNGRYSVHYKFNSRSGSFRFRMRLRPNDAYPYARGTSERLRVRVG